MYPKMRAEIRIRRDIARNYRKKSKNSEKYEVVAFDKFPERVEMAASSGAKPASTLLEVAQQADVFVTMLFDTKTTEEVYRRSSTRVTDRTRGTTGARVPSPLDEILDLPWTTKYSCRFGI